MEEPAGRVKVSELLLSLLERAHSAQDYWLADMPSFAACFYRSCAGFDVEANNSQFLACFGFSAIADQVSCQR